MRLNLLVIRTSHPEDLKSQYELLGMEFEYHRHGNGPMHYACEQHGFVFEIYPLQKGQNTVDASLRLGFTIANLTDTLSTLGDTNWIISSPIKETEWGTIAVLKDLDGRKVELTQVT